MNSLKLNSDENRTYYNNIRYTHKKPTRPHSKPILIPPPPSTYQPGH